MGAGTAQVRSLRPSRTPTTQSARPDKQPVRHDEAGLAGQRNGLVTLLAGGAVRSGCEIGPGQGVVSGTGLLPVSAAFHDLLPMGALQRGSVVAAGGWSLLCLALAGGPVAAGAWCAVAGVADFGVTAATDAGLDPARLLLVPDLGPNWPQVVVSLLDGCDLVLLRLPDRPSAQTRRKVEAAVRRFGGVLLVAGDWEGAQVRLRITGQAWDGIGMGHGRLRRRRVRVVADGRGEWSRSRARWLWLPGPDGMVTVAVSDSTDVEREEIVAGWPAGEGWSVGERWPAGTGSLAGAGWSAGEPELTAERGMTSVSGLALAGGGSW